MLQKQILEMERNIVYQQQNSMSTNPIVFGKFWNLPFGTKKLPFVIQLYRTHIFFSFAYSTLLSILFFTSHNGLHWKEEGVETTDVCILW